MRYPPFIFNIAELLLQVQSPKKISLPASFQKFIHRARKPRSNPHSCELKYFDERLVCYLYSQILALNKGILLHAAVVAKDNSGFIFFAKSGGGKSTLADLSRDYQVLGDDIIAMRQINRCYYAFATPWKQRLFINSASDIKVKISAILFLKKSRRLYFKPLPPEEALARILTCHVHFFIYTARSLARKIFFTASGFAKNIPAYEMGFSKNNNFWPCLEDRLSGISKGKH